MLSVRFFWRIIRGGGSEEAPSQVQIKKIWVAVYIFFFLNKLTFDSQNLSDAAPALRFAC